MVARTRRGERTVDEILAASRAVLLDVGLEGFSLREVARRVGIEPSAIYNHFDGKDALVNTLAFEAVQQLGVYLSSVPPHDSAAERLKAMGHAYLRYAAEEPERYRLVFDMLSTPPHTWDEYAAVAHPFSLIVAAVQAGLDSGEILDGRGVGASGVAYSLWCLVHGIVMLDAHHLARITEGLEPLKGAAVESFVDSLVATRHVARREGTQ